MKSSHLKWYVSETILFTYSQNRTRKGHQKCGSYWTIHFEMVHRSELTREKQNYCLICKPAKSPNKYTE